MANKKILIIDDDPDILNAAKIILEAHGYNTVTADGEDKGLTVFLKEKPDLILCDMMMEAVDSGASLTAKIRGHNKDIPIFLLSSIGNATSATIDISSYGFTGVFQKPFDPKSLIALVNKAFQ